MKETIISGKTSLGIELGSTRMKAILMDEHHNPIASGSYDWENQLIDGIWTYSEEDIWKGIQECYRSLSLDVKQKYDVELQKIGAIGFSGMMHGYMVFDKEGKLLVPFRTWRNTITEEASKELTTLFSFSIPQRWSIAHLYQAMLNEEEHLSKIHFQTTLAGYIHWKLTGEKVLGVGEASGMFPIDSKTMNFDQKMADQFDEEVRKRGYSFKIQEIFPQVLTAGQPAGRLTKEGAMLLDPTGHLESGIMFCPPEGDAGTGMVATNSVAVRFGNVSAGTSVFAMVVLEKALSKPYPQLDVVTTPDGSPVAMVHCNNCTSDLNAWVNLFDEFSQAFGLQIEKDELYGTLYRKALQGDEDCGGLLAYNYFSGEHITGFEEGRPLFVRKPESRFNLSNFMRVHLFTALGALKTGMDILTKEEGIVIDRMLGHGGFFKTEEVGQKVMAAAMNTPVSVMESSGEGGAWGIALLAAFMKEKQSGLDRTLTEFLNQEVFKNQLGTKVIPDERDVRGFETFLERYTKGLEIERAAVDYLS